MLLAGLALAVLLAELVNAADDARRDVFHQEEVDEPAARDFGLRDDVVSRQRADDRLSQLARITTSRFRQAHRHVGRKVTVRWVARTFHDNGGRIRDFGDDAAGELLQSRRNKLLELWFQGLAT